MWKGEYGGGLVEGDKERTEGGEWGNKERGYGGRGEHGGREGMEGGRYSKEETGPELNITYHKHLV